ncbi:MAG: oligopeptidase A [Burkholderia sp.]|jgi:oligopeptidase A
MDKTDSTANPLLRLDGLIDYAAVRPEHIAPAMKALSEELKSAIAHATAPGTEATWDAVCVPLEEASLRFSRAWGAVAHLQSVVDTPALREAYNAELPAVTQLFIDLSQNEALFAKYKAIEASKGFAALSPARQRIIRREIRDFRLSGADLPAPERARVKEIGEKLSLLSQKFSENLLDATNAWDMVLPDTKRLKGIPADTLALFAAQAKAAGKEGWRLTLQFPSYLPVMRYADDRSLRETVYRAFSTRASEFDGGKFDNTPLISEILKLRAEEAKLLGFKNYAEESLATKMAETPEQVIAFLRDLAKRSKPYAEKDMADLREFAAKELGIADLKPWDQAYAAEKLREARYSYSDQEVKRYFTEPTVFKGLFALVGKLYGIEIRPAEASVWNPDVKFFEIWKDGGKIAEFYADLYAREGKRSGAWMDGDRTRCVFRGKLQTPVAYLVCNFAPGVGGKPATLTHDEVTTLFHEFGHCLHHLLTAQTEAEVSGINGVEWDAVECPSQFMENFAWEWEVVEGLTSHVDTGEKLPRALFDKMLAAKNFEAGMQSVRQVEFALFDMLLHTEYDPSKETVQDVLDRVRREVAVSFPPAYNRFPQSFSHIFAGGYAAGYYSYKWAEVLSADAYGAFEEEGVLNPKTGERFLKEFLSRGSSRDAMESFVAFRGRRPTIDALMRHSGMDKKL